MLAVAVGIAKAESINLGINIVDGVAGFAYGNDGSTHHADHGEL